MFAEPGTLPEANRTYVMVRIYPRWQSSFAKSPCPVNCSSSALCFIPTPGNPQRSMKYINGFAMVVSLRSWTMRGQILRNVLPASAYRKLILTKIWINDDTDWKRTGRCLQVGLLLKLRSFRCPLEQLGHLSTLT